MQPDAPEDFVDYPRPDMRLHIPWWVRFTIWGSPNRNWVLGFGWFAVTFALICAVAAIALAARSSDAILTAAIAFVAALCGIPYFASVRWLDRHDGWQTVRPVKR